MLMPGTSRPGENASQAPAGLVPGVDDDHGGRDVAQGLGDVTAVGTGPLDLVEPGLERYGVPESDSIDPLPARVGGIHGDGDPPSAR